MRTMGGTDFERFFVKTRFYAPRVRDKGGLLWDKEEG